MEYIYSKQGLYYYYDLSLQLVSQLHGILFKLNIKKDETHFQQQYSYLELRIYLRY